jgi:hypothetical protein
LAASFGAADSGGQRGECSQHPRTHRNPQRSLIFEAVVYAASQARKSSFNLKQKKPPGGGLEK